MAADGLKKGDYDTLSAGVAAARYAALQAGVVDAAMVLPPLNFHAAKAGYPTIGLPYDYVKDIPFTGMAVHRAWARRTRMSCAVFSSRPTRASPGSPIHRIAPRRSSCSSRSAVEPRGCRGELRLPAPDRLFRGRTKVSRGQLKALMAIEKERGLVAKDLSADRLDRRLDRAHRLAALTAW